MGPTMREWLNKVAGTLREGAGDAAEEERCEDVLRTAMTERWRIELRPVRDRLGHSSGADEDHPMVTLIESVEAESFIVGQPLKDACSTQIESGRRLEITLLNRGRMRESETRNLGRAWTTTLEGKRIYGYRLNMLQFLTPERDRRDDFRLAIDAEYGAMADVFFPGGEAPPVSGVINNISRGGIQLRAITTPTGWKPEWTLQLRMHLPEPAGAIETEAVLRHVTHHERGFSMLGMQFREELPAVGKLIRRIELIRAQRMRKR